MSEQIHEPFWLHYAMRELGVKEIPGVKSHPRILDYFEATRFRAKDDAVPWCAAFVCWCLEAAGVRSTRSARAADYATWGEPCELRPGAIVVFGKADPDAGGSGHVAFYSGKEEGEFIHVLGGNQSNAVNVAKRPKSRIVAVRWPVVP